MKILCKCGLPKEEHCEYEPVMPEGCTCDPEDWGSEVTPVCPEYRQWDVYPDEDICEKCQHPKECHK
jgi:hypothetical protein